MSFRDNLQHLRATRNMTQEQLAMLLGVSRQSVTKWEAEKSYPEMDKLLKMCQIFECSLDDLVQGDLTGRAGAYEPATVPAGPPQDICGYDEHQRMLAWKVPTGVAAILVGIGVGLLLEGRAVPFFLKDTSASDLPMIVCIFIGIVIGLEFLVTAGMEHTAFVKAHPYIEDFYTEDERARARRNMAQACVAGVGLIFVGCACIIALGEYPSTEREGLCLLMLFIAAGSWLIIRYGMLLGRTNVAEYNRSVADDLELEDIASAQLDDARREELLRRKRKSDRLGAVCATIMIVATIVGLGLLFWPVLTSPNPDAFEPEGTSAMWFWLAWPAGGLICGVVAVLWKAFGDAGDRG